ncbi:hypothetical protein [Escherichia coli]|uniref:F4 family fimbrial subunit n=1 Tax=Escherichia coli TaxID=562 RepID=UPI0037C11469
MKKTLIALAVAASAAVSGSAMAAGWEQNGTGGSVDLGGTLTPVEKEAVWEVKVGDGVNNLNASVEKGQSRVDIVAGESILALGIRTANNQAFDGQPSISPQINFNDAIDLNAFEGGVTTLTLEVKDETGINKIGMLTAPFNTGAVGSVTGPNGLNIYSYMSAKNPNGVARGFAGGLSADWNKVNKAPQTVLNALSTEIMANFDAQGMSFSGNGLASDFATSGAKYSAAYGAGILAGDTITIALDQPVTGNAEIAWKATLPVTVSYQ